MFMLYIQNPFSNILCSLQMFQNKHGLSWLTEWMFQIPVYINVTKGMQHKYLSKIQGIEINRIFFYLFFFQDLLLKQQIYMACYKARIEVVVTSYRKKIGKNSEKQLYHTNTEMYTQPLNVDWIRSPEIMSIVQWKLVSPKIETAFSFRINNCKSHAALHSLQCFTIILQWQGPFSD